MKGDLRDISILQLLNLIHLARRTGMLHIEGEQQIWMAFRNGNLLYASTENGRGQLAHILWQSGRISHQQKCTIQTHAQGRNERQLVRLLIQNGYLSQSDISLSFKQYAMDLIDDLITWQEGKFRFERDQLPPADRIYVAINLDNLIKQGEKHWREWLRLRQELPDLEFRLVCPSQPRTHLHNIQLNCQEWRVIAASNTYNTAHQIARANQLGAFQIRRIVYGLAQAGLVEVIRPPQLVPQLA